MLPFQISAPRWGGVSHLPGYSNPKKTSTPKGTCPDPSRRTLQNVVGTCPRDWHKSDTISSGSVHGAETKSAAPKALGNGAYDLMRGLVADLFTRDTNTDQGRDIQLIED